MFTRWLSPLPSGRSRRKAPRHPRQRVARLTIEALEDRYVPSTLTVTSALDDGSAGTLRDAVNAAVAGDVITFDPSLNGQTITLTQGQLNIAKDLTLQGPGAGLLSISGNNASRVFNVEASSVVNVSISGLTVTGGNGTDTTSTTDGTNTTTPTGGNGTDTKSPPDGKGTDTPTSPTDGKGTDTTTNLAGGGAIRSNNANLTLIDLTVSDNHTEDAGGGILNQDGTLTVRDSTISHNTAGTAGGGIFSDGGTLSVVNTTLSDNTAGTDGGGLADDTSVLTLQADTISSNTAGGQGGGVHVKAPTGAVLVDTTTVANNTATGDGGGLFTGSASPASFTIQGSTFLSNTTTTGRGGGLAVVLNTAGGPASILRSIIGNNSAPTQGGGGVFLDGNASTAPVLIGYTTLAGNQAGDGAGDNGGGLLINNAGGSVSLVDSTISSNSTAGAGAGIFEHHTNGSFLLLSSTITDNNAAISGGGLQVDSGATLTQLESTIIAGNATATIGPDVVNAGSIIAANNNLIENSFAGTPPASQAANLVGQDPLLGPLQDNGGPTPTEAPLPGSPILDKGSNPAGLANDQRGFARTIGTQTDIGAVEIDPNAPTASLVSAPPVDASSPPGLYDFQVAFDDHRGIRVDSLAAAVRVTGPNLFNQIATLVSVDGTNDDPHRVATYSLTPPGGVWTDTANGTYTIAIEPDTAQNVDGNPVPPGTIGTFTVDLTDQVPSTAPRPKQFYAVGVDAFITPQLRVVTSGPRPGSRPVPMDVFNRAQVRVYDAGTGALQGEFNAYANRGIGGVRVAVADMDGDGIPDIITAPGPGVNSQPLVKIWSGAAPRLIGSFFAYAPSFQGGVFVAVGDVNGDGHPDIITGADAGAGPHVKVFNGADGSEMYSFFAFDGSYTGGVRVAAGDVNGDGKADIIVGAGTVPHVRVFSGDGSMLASFMAYGRNYNGGVFVAAGDLDGDGHADIITGPDAGGHGQVKLFNGGNGAQTGFFAFGRSYNGATHVGTADVDGDGKPDILVGSSQPVGPHLEVFAGTSLATLASFWALPPSFVGIYVS